MKIENQICTLEQGLRLRDLGVEQQTAYFFYWQEIVSKNPNHRTYGHRQIHMPWELSKGYLPSTISTNRVFQECAVYSAAELGRMLGYGTSIHPRHEIEAHKRADLLIADLESGVTTAAQANARLKQE